MNNLLEHQVDCIEAVLTRHKVPARVTGGIVTPRWIRFQVVPAPGARITSITSLEEELAAVLNVPLVRTGWQGCAIVVEVPRDDSYPVRLLPLLQGLHNVPPVTAVLGIADDGVPLLIRLPSLDMAHILVAGTTGSGKTVLLRAIVLSLAYFNRPQTPGLGPRSLTPWGHRPLPADSRPQPPVIGGPSSVVFVLVDPKGSAFRVLERLPHLGRPVISDPAEAVEALGSLVRLMNRRQGLGNGSRERTPIVLVIDELVDLLMAGGTEAEQPLTRLLQRGREAGIHVVAATQKPTAAVIGSLVKANFPMRVVGKVVSAEDARVATGREGTGAERLIGWGDFIAVAEGQLHRFQAAYIAPEEVRQVTAEIRKREKSWDGCSGAEEVCA